MRKKSTSKAVSRHSLFGPPPVLDGEDHAAYDELFGRVSAAVKPIDVIDEMLIDDVVLLHLETLRRRRFISALIQARGHEALEDFLRKHLDYNHYRKRFTDDLTEILQNNLAEGQAEHAQMLAHDCGWNQSDAVDKVSKILSRIGLRLDTILERARHDKADELAQAYLAREPSAVKLIHQLLAGARVSIDALMAEGLVGLNLDRIERIDQLATGAENRRNASLREIDRRRAVLGETLRPRALEDGEFHVIETTPAEGKDGLDDRPQD
jgi:hypothetical protein